VGAVSHKVVFRADEAGAEGAAATAVVMTRSMADDPFEMVVDRPFWLVVQDKASGAVLIEARVTDPGTRWKK
jgi:serpin B